MLRFTLLILMFALPYAASRSECGSGCTTTITVRDCDNDPVPGLKVDIKTCCDNASHEAVTNSAGEVPFPYCAKDICGSKISLNDRAISAFDPNSCQQSGKNSKCTVTICSKH